MRKNDKLAKFTHCALSQTLGMHSLNQRYRIVNNVHEK